MQITETVQFGYHLTIDMYACDRGRLNDMKNCHDALKKLVSVLGMNELIPPIVIQAAGNQNRGGKDPGGYSGFVMIEESHISLHTFVNRGFVSIDVYSCKVFDKELAIKHFKEVFKSEDIETYFINRGTRYPTKDIYA